MQSRSLSIYKAGHVTRVASASGKLEMAHMHKNVILKNTPIG